MVRRETGVKPARAVPLIALGTLLVLVTILRGENIVLTLCVPALLVAGRLARPLRAAALAVLVLAAVVVFRGPVSRNLIGRHPDLPDWRNRYLLTLMVNPMCFMVQNNYVTATPAEDLAILNESINMEQMPRLYTPFLIPYYWNALPARFTDEKAARFKSMFVRAVLNNPGLFLGNRVTTFVGTLGMGQPILYCVVFDRTAVTPDVLYSGRKDVLARAGLLVDFHNQNALQRTTSKICLWSIPLGGIGKPGYWIWNSAPALIVVVLSLLARRWVPTAALAASVVALPLVLIFLAAPASHFRYLTDLYVLGFVMPVIILYDLSKRSSPAGRTTLAQSSKSVPTQPEPASLTQA